MWRWVRIRHLMISSNAVFCNESSRKNAIADKMHESVTDIVFASAVPSLWKKLIKSLFQAYVIWITSSFRMRQNRIVVWSYWVILSLQMSTVILQGAEHRQHYAFCWLHFCTGWFYWLYAAPFYLIYSHMIINISILKRK